MNNGYGIIDFAPFLSYLLFFIWMSWLQAQESNIRHVKHVHRNPKSEIDRPQAHSVLYLFGNNIVVHCNLTKLSQNSSDAWALYWTIINLYSLIVLRVAIVSIMLDVLPKQYYYRISTKQSELVVCRFLIWGYDECVFCAEYCFLVPGVKTFK